METVKKRNPGEIEFHQAVLEVLETLEPVIEAHPGICRSGNNRPSCRAGESHQIPRAVGRRQAARSSVNSGFRMQFNSAIGPYKGGLRFHPSVYEGIIKFLGFEQIFKNSLTGLPIGGGKGGSDFDPEGQERQRGHAFLPELHDRAFQAHRRGHRRSRGRHRCRRTRDRLPRSVSTRDCATSSPAFSPVRALTYGGSLARTEATGYGLCYFTDEMLQRDGQVLQGQDRRHLRFRATWRSTLAKRRPRSARRSLRSPIPTDTSATRTESTLRL